MSIPNNIEWLYQKLQNADLLPYVDSKVIPKNTLELKQIKHLQTIRNTFTHQQPALYVYTFEELIESANRVLARGFDVSVKVFMSTKHHQFECHNAILVAIAK